METLLPVRGARYVRTRALDWVAEVGRVAILLGDITRFLASGVRAFGHVVQQMGAIGVGSLWLVLVVSVFTGAVAAVQAAYQMRDYVPMIYLGTVIDRPGIVRNTGGIKRLIADRRGGQTVAAFVEACNRCVGLDAETTDDHPRAMWEKYVTLVAMSGSTGLTRRPAGDIVKNPETRRFLRMLIEETIAVARARGITLPEGFADDRMAWFDRLPPVFKASMLEDLERGRRLELPWLSSRIHGLGKELGIATPANSAVHYGLILHQDGR